MQNDRTERFVGLDVHKDSITAAVSEGGALEAARDLGRIAHDLPRLLKLLARVGAPQQLHVCYEAGPTGYGLCRALRAHGIDCIVVAPSKTPQPPGGRIKTDRRDAQLLAHYLRTNSLVAVAVPDEQAEALRDFVRLREDAVWALQAARQQLGGFLLRHGRTYPGKSAWTNAHITWIRSLRFEIDLQRRSLDQYLAEVIRLKERLDQLTEQLVEQLESAPQSELFKHLQALRGVHTIVASTIVAEIGDLRRFKSASHFMSFVGLTPSERSSGNDVRRGRITKAGNPHVRRVLIEAAWCARYRPARSHHMQLRLARTPLEVQDIAWKAQVRLHHRYRRMLMRGKTLQHTIVAIARELAGFVWAIGQRPPEKAA
jgi:transposase